MMYNCFTWHMVAIYVVLLSKLAILEFYYNHHNYILVIANYLFFAWVICHGASTSSTGLQGGIEYTTMLFTAH